MTPEINRLIKNIKQKESEFNTFDQKKYGSSAREDLHDEIAQLKIKLANRIINHLK